MCLQGPSNLALHISSWAVDTMMATCDLAESIFDIKESWDDLIRSTESFSQKGIGVILILICDKASKSH